MVEGLPARKASNSSILTRLKDQEVDDQISLPRVKGDRLEKQSRR